MDLIVWLGFILSLVLMVLIARKNLWLGFFVGAIVLGVFNLSIVQIWQQIAKTLTTPSTLLMAFAVGIIPLIGGVLETTGMMTALVSNLNISRKLFLIFGPAFFGMLPMPGGALLSAPLVFRAGADIPNEQYAAINVWFRHALILIYPLGALLVTTKIANLNLYTAVLYMLPGFILMLILGYFFLLRGVHGKLTTKENPNLKKILLPIIVIVSAPAIHLSLMTIFPKLMTEIPLIIGVVFSFFLSLFLGKMNLKKLLPISKKMKPWKFFLIIIGMFLFINIFQASNVSRIIANIVFSRHFLLIVIGAFLGFVTGRVQMPFAIVLPIYLSTTGFSSIGYLTFATMFFAIYMGYIISPIHPCVSVSIEFFGSNLKDFFKKLYPIILISLTAATVVSLFFT
ncbi:MAG: DUF401 family protein [Candidatus Cloacimonadota bacterium]|nr:DUF401 family protein [Candidatus Cloacimonadota bacterium]